MMKQEKSKGWTEGEARRAKETLDARMAELGRIGWLISEVLPMDTQWCVQLESTQTGVLYVAYSEEEMWQLLRAMGVSPPDPTAEEY